MLDLCYNCSSCHIGACPRNLHQCEICYAWGHQYIFCPRGVTQRDPNYRYWALCHNCDIWHLPNVCETPYHDCAQCGHAGHLEIFCPVNPTDRMPHKHEQRRRLLAGAPPTTNHDYRQPFSGIIPQEYISRMKLDGVRQAFSMLDQGFHPNQVIMFMSGPPPPPGNIPMTPGSTPATFQLPGTVQHGVTQHAARARIPSNVPFQPAGHQTSSPESADAKHVDEFGTYISMHHRFRQGDLARSIQQERPMDTVPMTENLSLTHGLPQLGQVQPSKQIATPMTPVAATQVQSTGLEPQSALAGLQDDGSETQAMATIERTEDVGPVKKARQKKATKAKTDREDTPAGSTAKQGPRCAACIKSHKRCKHRAQQESPTPQPPSDPSFVTPSAPANYLPVSGAPEGYVQAPPTLPDHSFTLPAENTTVSAPVEKKAATTKRKH